MYVFGLQPNTQRETNFSGLQIILSTLESKLRNHRQALLRQEFEALYIKVGLLS